MGIRLLVMAALATVVLLTIIAAPATGAPPYGEDPTIAWQRLLGGIGNDEGHAVQETSDGGYILLGTSDSSASGDVTGANHGNNDVWVVKLNSAGVVQWQKLLGGNDYDYGMSVQQTSDGGYVLLGYSSSSLNGDVTGATHGNHDYWVVKLNSAGVIQWQRLLGGSGSELGMSVQQTADGGYVLLGYSYSSASGDVTGTNHGNRDIWVVKLNSAGVILWQKLLGGSGEDRGNSIQQTTDGGYILLGYSYSSASGDVTGANHGYSDFWVVKLNNAGDILWQKLLGGSDSDFGASVQQTSDGGYVLLGHAISSLSGDVTGTNHGIWDYWVVKLDSAGMVQWDRLLGGGDRDEGLSVRQTSDGGYVLLGASYSSANGDVLGTNHGIWDYWVVKLDRRGATLWEKLLGGSSTDYGKAVQETSDGGYVLLGYTYSSASSDVAAANHGGEDYWVVKLKAVPGIHLEPGWNFVSVPAVLAPGSDTAAIFAGVDTAGHSVFLYDATAKVWTPMTATTKVRPLDGIWIYSKAAVTVPLAFDMNPQAVPPTKDLAAGWNAIGFGSLQSATARDALSPVVSKWSTLKGFDALHQRYEMSIINGGTGDYSHYREVFAGKGYWLYMREAGQLAGM